MDSIFGSFNKTSMINFNTSDILLESKKIDQLIRNQYAAPIRYTVCATPSEVYARPC